MTRGQASVIGERVAVLETKFDAVQAAIKDLAESVEAMRQAQIAGIEDGKKDRAELKASVDLMQRDIKAMQPTVTTIKDLEKAGRLGMRLIALTAAIVTAIAAAIASAKGWIILNVNWLMGR
jgi:hypothetical protein